MITLIFLSPAALLLATAAPEHVVPVMPTVAVVAATAPTFDPANPPSWWTDKMRQPCSKSGDRVIC